MKLFISVGLLMWLIIADCKNSKNENKSVRKENVNENCKKLNDSAARLLSKFSFEQKNILLLDTALGLLNKATLCDTNYLTAYYNKITILNIKGDYDQSLLVFNKILSLTENNPQILFFKGLIYEKLSKSDSAKLAYKRSEKRFKELLKVHPDDFNLIGNKLLLIDAADGKAEAKLELQKYILKYPGNKILLNYKTIIDSFDKDDYLKETRLRF